MTSREHGAALSESRLDWRLCNMHAKQLCSADSGLCSVAEGENTPLRLSDCP